VTALIKFERRARVSDGCEVVGALSSLSPTVLRLHVDTLAALLEHEDWDIRAGAEDALLECALFDGALVRALTEGMVKQRPTVYSSSGRGRMAAFLEADGEGAGAGESVGEDSDLDEPLYRSLGQMGESRAKEVGAKLERKLEVLAAANPAVAEICRSARNKALLLATARSHQRQEEEQMAWDEDTPVYDIGEWLAAPLSETAAPAERLLLDPLAADAAALSSGTVAEVIRGAHGPPPSVVARGDGAPSVLEQRGALSGEQCAVLAAELDGAVTWSKSKEARRDLKLIIAETELRGLVGDLSVDGLLLIGHRQLARLGTPAARLQFKLRRGEALAGTEYDRIPFHRDHSLVVVNVALNDDFDGAKLIFAEGERLSVPIRGRGDATVHDCTVVHAVSRLASGVRYNLYAVFEPVTSAAAA